ETNIVVVVNHFNSQSFPFVLKGFKESLILMEKNLGIIKVKRVLNLNGDEISSFKDSPNGWHIIEGKEDFYLYINQEFDDNIFAEVECYNKQIITDNPYFEEYIPGKIYWHDVPINSFKHEYQNSVFSLIQIINSDKKFSKDIFNMISELLIAYNSTFKVEFKNVEVMEFIKPTKLVNYIVPKIFSMISCETNTSNFLLLKNIVKEIQKKTETNNEFLFNTPLGECVIGDI
ncbi:MAG: hypothetical protein ACK5XN_29010, partial [Bacteroidota bacterium]